MTDVKRLLDSASPLPWSENEFDLYITDAQGDPVHWDQEGLGAVWGKDENPALIVAAVNLLPDLLEVVTGWLANVWDDPDISHDDKSVELLVDMRDIRHIRRLLNLPNPGDGDA